MELSANNAPNVLGEEGRKPVETVQYIVIRLGEELSFSPNRVNFPQD